jgi:hypothetical protein
VSIKITVRILLYELIPLKIDYTEKHLPKNLKHVSINVFIHSKRKPKIDKISQKQKYSWHLIAFIGTWHFNFT